MAGVSHFPTSSCRAPTIKQIVTVTVIALVGVGAYFLGRHLLPSTGSLDSSPPTLEASNLDFGETWERPDFVWEVTIRNHSDLAIHIDDFGRSCGWSKVEPPSLDIPPQSARNVRFTLDLSDTPSCGAVETDEVRLFAATVTPNVNGATIDSTPRWSLRGRVRTALRIDPRVVSFQSQSELAQPLAEQSVRVLGLTDLETLRIEPAHDGLFVASLDRANSERKEFIIKVRPRRDLPVGSCAGQFTLVPVLRDGSTLPGKILSVTGEIVSDIQAIPPAVLLGTRPVGEKFEENIELYSLTGRPFEVVSVSQSSNGTSVEAQSSAATKYTIRQEIEHLSFKEETIRFSVKYRDGSVTTASVPVRYHGVEPVR